MRCGRSIHLASSLLIILTLAFVLGSPLLAQTAPSITGLSQSSGTLGTPITITGTNFGSTQGTVTFNGVAASVSSWNTTTIATSVPVAATTGNIVVHISGLDSNPVPFTVIGPVSYVYDDSGRLTGVMDGYGNAATYTYDAVGNILSINQVSSSQVSVIQFTPARGPVGTSVTVYGTGFSPTAGQNTVSFNGASATVVSATSTQIQVTVPAAAASGSISVTSPFGTATSAAGFTVTTSAGTPTITSFTPQNAAAGASLNVVGTNFDPALSNNKLRVNASAAVVSSVTSTTSITGAVPSATASGHVSIITPSGRAVSAQDLYIPFGSHVPADIGFTARITPGNTQTVTLAASKIGLVLFDAVAGQQISIQMSGSTFTTCTLYVIAPNNTTITPKGCTAGTSNLGSTYLPKSGTYTIGIDPGTSSGSITITLTADVVGTIVPGGPPVTVTTTQPGQGARLTFTAASSQRVSMNITNSTYQTCSIGLYRPDGSNVSSANCNASGFWDIPTLSQGGVSTFVITPLSNSTGHVTLQLNDASDVVAPIAVDGSAVTVTTAVAGQDARLTFTGTAGQKIVVYATSVSNPSAYLYLVKPDGSNQTSVFVTNYPSGQIFFIDTQTLATTGTYQLWVQHQGTYVGSETLRVASVPADFSSTLTVPATGQTGPAVRVPSSGNLAAGQNATLTFSGTSGQKLSFNVLSPTFSSCSVYIYNPSGGQIYGGSNCATGMSGYIDTLTLSATGTYSILINPAGAATGSVSVSINNDSDVTGTIAVDGSAVTVTTIAGQDARLTFTGTAGQKIVVYATSVSNPSAYLYLVKPDGSNQTSVFVTNYPSGQIFFMDKQTLATAGTYQLWVQHQGTNVGSETLQAASVPADVSGSVTIGGSALAVSTVAAQNANITFSNPASQSVTIHWTSGTYPTTLACYVRVTGPSPSTTQIGFVNCNTATGALSLGTLAAGTYNILIDPQLQSSGGLSLTVTTP